MGLPPTGGSDGAGSISGGGYLRLPPPEQSCTVYFDQSHYVPVSRSGAQAGVKGGQAVVRSGRTGFGGDVYDGSGAGTDRRGVGDGRYGYGDGDGFYQW